MKAAIDGNPDFGNLWLTLDAGDKVLAESGAMAHMSADVEVKTRLMGGFFKALVRRLLAGESLLVGEYTGRSAGSRLAVSPALPGEVGFRDFDGDGYYFQAGSFLASTPGIALKTKFVGLKALFSGEGAFFLYCTGTGRLWYNAYGAIVERDVDGELFVDTGHVVGWEPTLTWKISGTGNFFSTMFSGEGLLLHFQGRGKVLLQTRSVGALVSWTKTYLR
ncbi:MAG: TIGR00266 family protein [Candidatus Schekmanbacteria bacterium]|nr:TIGR00266 family protein [Candidatus Schekmanbacteria bacterium]